MVEMNKIIFSFNTFLEFKKSIVESRCFNLLEFRGNVKCFNFILFSDSISFDHEYCLFKICRTVLRGEAGTS